MKKVLLIVFAIVLFTTQNINAQSTASLAADINTGANGSNPAFLTSFNGKLYFSATSSGFEAELWQYDGAVASLAANINPIGQSSPTHLTVFNNKLYFVADNNTNGSELMSCDMSNNVVLVADINTYTLGFSYISDLTVFGSNLYFKADDSEFGTSPSLWKYDGTNPPTVVPGTIGINPTELIVYSGKLYFSAENGAAGNELWSTDGITASLVYDINPGAAGSYPTSLAVFNNKLFFSADDGTNGGELWQFDATTPTTATMIEIVTGSFGAYPSELTTFGGKLYFSADNSSNGIELFVYDGINPPVMVDDIFPGGPFDSSSPTNLVSYNDTLYFSALHPTNGLVIWQYGGTGVPTTFTNQALSDMTYPTIHNNRLYFSANHNDTGTELYFIRSGCEATATLSGSTSTCQLATAPILTFTGANSVAPYAFSYTINGGPVQTLTTASTIATLSVPTTTAGVFTYTLVSVAANGCSQAQTGNAVVTINESPTANLTGTTSVCQNAPAPVLTFTVSGGGVNPYLLYYNINNAPTPVLTITTGNIATISAHTNTTGTYNYNFTAVVDNNLCFNLLTSIATVTVNPKPVVDLGSDIYLLASSPQKLDAKNVGSTYSWSTSEFNQIIEPSVFGSYSVTVTNAFGCVNSDNINIINTGPQTRFVNAAATGANNGTSWVDAFTNLKTAIDAARNGDNIFVAAGTYQIASGQSFNMKENVKLYGGFVGNESGLSDRILSANNSSTIDWNQNKIKWYNNPTNASYISLPFTILDGFTITGGSRIYFEYSSPIISNCIIKNNNENTVGSPEGGFINIDEQSSPTFINCVISGNSALIPGSSSVLIKDRGTPVFINCTIYGNTTSHLADVYPPGSLKIYNSIVSENTSGMIVNYSTIDIKNSLIQGMADNSNGNIDGTKTYDLFVNAATGDYRLKPTAVAVNAGSNAFVTSYTTTDLDGNSRIFDGNVDMGAYELQTAVPVLSNVICVTQNGAGLKNGNGWANAYDATQLQLAINNAIVGNVIAVAVGTYTPAANSSFSMKEGVSMFGGFAGTETHINQRNITSYTTVLKGNGSSVIANNNNGVTTLTALDGFTITGGNGGIKNYYASPTISNCIISNNLGSGITNDYTSSKIINCNINSNIKSVPHPAVGGGVNNHNCPNISIINCSIGNNTLNVYSMPSDYYSAGGGIYTANSTMEVINCSIGGNKNNDAKPRGGGISILSSKFTIKNSIVYGNTTNLSNGFLNNSKGIEIIVSTYTITNSLIEGMGANPSNSNPNGTTNLQNLFIDAANGDLRLGSDASAAGVINSGSSSAISSYTTTDLAGNARIFGAAVDIGCYESNAPKATNITVSTNPNWVIKNSRNILKDLQLGSPEQKDLQTHYSLLQAAIDAAYPGDSIYVEKGIYTPGIDSAFVMKEGVHIFGGFNGTETSFAERDLNAGHETILRGNGTSVIINDDNELTNLAELNGFTLENGTGKDVDGLTYGGAIYNYKASPTISNCKIQNNTANYGAGVFNDNNSKPVILRSQILNNNALGDGGAVFSNYNSDASITNCLIKGNTAGINGGAVYSNFMSNTKITNSTIVNNNAVDEGGALLTNGSTVKMANSIVLNNTASSNAGVYNFMGGVNDITYSLTQGINTGTGNLDGTTTYTLFVNEAANNYRLKCGVAAIDAGRNDSIPSNGNIDLAQNSRTYDGTVDLGAYEYGAFSRPKAAKRQTVCSNSDIVFKSFISDESGATYQWFKAPNGSNTFTAIATAIKDSLLLSAVAQADSGSRYFVEITNGCGMLHSDTMTLKVNRLSIINLGADRAVCANLNPTLDANNYGEMLWSDGSNNASLPLLNSGAYSLQFTDLNGCLATDDVNIVVNTVDTLVTVNLSTLTVSHANASSYQWIKSDGVGSYTIVSGETSQTFTATENGDYAVIVNTAEGCVDTSSYKTIVNVSIKENADVKSILGVYPNPTNGDLTISSSEVMQQVEITDVMGRVVYNNKPIATKHTLNMATEPKGVYLVKVNYIDGTDVIKIIKH